MNEFSSLKMSRTHVPRKIRFDFRRVTAVLALEARLFTALVPLVTHQGAAVFVVVAAAETLEYQAGH